jgi:acyl carrier protein phosphodiesterase
VNLLAHLALAATDTEHRAGAVLADFRKGADLSDLPARIREGVQHHRRVDGFTDRHPVVQRSIARLGGRWGWFGGILIDVYYDHLLAQAWTGDLPAFVREVAPALSLAAQHAEPGAVPFLTAFAQNDGLLRYATFEGIEATLAGLSRRIRERIPNRAIDLVPALSELEAERLLFERDFAEFWPELQRHAGDGRME